METIEATSAHTMSSSSLPGVEGMQGWISSPMNLSLSTQGAQPLETDGPSEDEGPPRPERPAVDHRSGQYRNSTSWGLSLEQHT